jgi:hypothetical protein
MTKISDYKISTYFLICRILFVPACTIRNSAIARNAISTKRYRHLFTERIAVVILFSCVIPPDRILSRPQVQIVAGYCRVCPLIVSVYARVVVCVHRGRVRIDKIDRRIDGLGIVAFLEGVGRVNYSVATSRQRPSKHFILVAKVDNDRLCALERLNVAGVRFVCKVRCCHRCRGQSVCVARLDIQDVKPQSLQGE